MKDEHGAHAVFQEISASPAGVHSANCTIAYGALPGHSCQTSDAMRAYIQSKLGSKHETWVLVPPELRPAHWKMKRPMCRLDRALYGHPESGAHWERHLETAVIKIGGEPVENFPSSYWFPGPRMLLTVYVDDLLLAGPDGQHESMWAALLGKGIDLEDPEPLSRFLGRTHTTDTAATK